MLALLGVLWSPGAHKVDEVLLRFETGSEM